MQGSIQPKTININISEAQTKENEKEETNQSNVEDKQQDLEKSKESKFLQNKENLLKIAYLSLLFIIDIVNWFIETKPNIRKIAISISFFVLICLEASRFILIYRKIMNNILLKDSLAFFSNLCLLALSFECANPALKLLFIGLEIIINLSICLMTISNYISLKLINVLLASFQIYFRGTIQEEPVLGSVRYWFSMCFLIIFVYFLSSKQKISIPNVQNLDQKSLIAKEIGGFVEQGIALIDENMDFLYSNNYFEEMLCGVDKQSILMMKNMRNKLQSEEKFTNEFDNEFNAITKKNQKALFAESDILGNAIRALFKTMEIFKSATVIESNRNNLPAELLFQTVFKQNQKTINWEFKLIPIIKQTKNIIIISLLNKTSEQENKSQFRLQETVQRMVECIAKEIKSLVGIIKSRLEKGLENTDYQINSDLNAVHLLSDYLLMLAASPEGKSTIKNFTECNLIELCKTAIESVNGKASSKGIITFFNFEPLTKWKIVNDPKKLQWTLVYILEDALRSTFSGTLSVKVMKSCPVQRRIEIQVIVTSEKCKENLNSEDSALLQKMSLELRVSKLLLSKLTSSANQELRMQTDKSLGKIQSFVIDDFHPCQINNIEKINFYQQKFPFQIKNKNYLESMKRDVLWIGKNQQLKQAERILFEIFGLNLIIDNIIDPDESTMFKENVLMIVVSREIHNFWERIIKIHTKTCLLLIPIILIGKEFVEDDRLKCKKYGILHFIVEGFDIMSLALLLDKLGK